MSTENTALATITEADKVLAQITNVSDARKMVSLAKGLLTTATKEYKAAETTQEAKEGRDEAYETAVRAGELRLKTEAKLGEILERDIQHQGGRPSENGDNVVTVLKEIGLTKKESSRAQNIWSHQDLIQKAVNNALKSKDIPTRVAIERLIKDRVREEKYTPPAGEYEQGSDILTGDMSQLWDYIPNDSVDLFFTDPPYEKAGIGCFQELAKLAQAKLKANGLCLTYSGHVHLPLVIELMKEHLDYWWTFAVFLSGAELRIWSRKLWNRWKPILVFSKKPMNGRLTDIWCTDYIRGEGEDKRYHKWGQNVQEATYWIESLTPPNGLVVDPYCGGGTIPVACKLTDRRWLATDKDSNTTNRARQRIEAIKNDKTCSDI